MTAQADADEDLDGVVSVDFTIVRAHQLAAGARRRGGPAAEPDDHAVGAAEPKQKRKPGPRKTEFIGAALTA
ncbi:hypothetical protein JL475_23850 [Streptomyces sp. M2CJ-2]|uniref:hypothetical protein n=1 Tax=Streptomyces sp. M2CJ-2 TaxID=2803948 RepID=UPI001927ED26|nr:hypothetical protein [Streptomyces sp. M2CJ-2]MBL3668973.1 hypothetical protein [Streptomyces sp. M2CJ-2]